MKGIWGGVRKTSSSYQCKKIEFHRGTFKEQIRKLVIQTQTANRYKLWYLQL